VVDVERRLAGGFARGVLRLGGTGADAGRTLEIDLQNEYLIARADDGEVLAVVPDLICLVDADTAEPVTTEVVRYACGSSSSASRARAPQDPRGAVRRRTGGLRLPRRAVPSLPGAYGGPPRLT
jgi:hypothetical protein